MLFLRQSPNHEMHCVACHLEEGLGELPTEKDEAAHATNLT